MQDGWDGWNPANLQGIQSAFLLLYRENGPGWTGPTGFYSSDLEAPIPFGGSKTWWDMYLWSQGWTPPDNIMTVWVNNAYRPFILRAVLVVDYVPESLGWTGPMEYQLDMGQDYFIPLPVPTVTDPLQGTRMHITVYPLIPEPGSLVALTAGILGLAWRRKRQAQAPFRTRSAVLVSNMRARSIRPCPAFFASLLPTTRTHHSADTAAAPPFDMENRPRPGGGGTDMGAYEDNPDCD
jgi:hypothetical protein